MLSIIILCMYLQGTFIYAVAEALLLIMHAHTCTRMHTSIQESRRAYAFKYMLNELRMTLKGKHYYPIF